MKIAIAGYGIEGKASYDYWNTSDNDVVIADEREQLDDLPAGAVTLLGGDAFSRLGEFDLIIRSPGINPKKLPYAGKVWSTTNEFFEKCPAPIIGVTGTKGKGTTSSLITSILEAAGQNVHLVGNIGTPSLTELPKITSEDIVVFELSSFQLWDLRRSPHIAVVLGIESDHLDVHGSMEDYVVAKSNIVRFQTPDDIVVFNKDNEIASSIAKQSAAERVEYPFELSQEIVASIRLPGPHNIENASAAIAAVKEYVHDEDTIKQGLTSFTGLPHRLKFVREVNGVKFYDDSIATTPGSALAAINSFTGPKVLILGGIDKGGGYDDVIAEAKATGTTVIVMGATRDAIAALCRVAGVSCHKNDGDMVSVVKQAAEVAMPGAVVILSPASSSFDMFKNYADRGDQFIAAVNSL